VLGFLAALWLAPLIEAKVPSVFLILAGVPVMALLVGKFWSTLPAERRARIAPGMEWICFVPILLLTIWGLWHLGPVVEAIFCQVKDANGQTIINPKTGQPLADFRQWWPQVSGTSFDQRNSLVVGFMMGFAVIPVIFTIAEDSLSNVPASLTAASAALGASRWQTLRTIVLPIASAGIFSALMIGLGRAVGETMIVVMATGNTPIMEWNLFNGMRTLSANIATELPEAPVHSTLYRTLFLGALVLFFLTFVLNTVAELLRQRLREKYKLV
jgi:phosphate transport system permease protein